MTQQTRRIFMLRFVATGATLGAISVSAQTGGPRLEESDPQAVALGYKQDTSKVDAKKYPNHASTQTCANCQLFQGKATDPSGGCPLFGAKQVASGGWCSAWNKKAG